MTASAIQIKLDRMNTFGDEQFGEPSVLKSYFYAISDISIGGRLVEDVHLFLFFLVLPNISISGFLNNSQGLKVIRF